MSDNNRINKESKVVTLEDSDARNVPEATATCEVPESMAIETSGRRDSVEPQNLPPTGSQRSPESDGKTDKELSPNKAHQNLSSRSEFLGDETDKDVSEKTEKTEERLEEKKSKDAGLKYSIETILGIYAEKRAQIEAAARYLYLEPESEVNLGQNFVGEIFVSEPVSEGSSEIKFRKENFVFEWPKIIPKPFNQFNRQNYNSNKNYRFPRGRGGRYNPGRGRRNLNINSRRQSYCKWWLLDDNEEEVGPLSGGQMRALFCVREIPSSVLLKNYSKMYFTKLTDMISRNWNTFLGETIEDLNFQKHDEECLMKAEKSYPEAMQTIMQNAIDAIPPDSSLMQDNFDPEDFKKFYRNYEFLEKNREHGDNEIHSSRAGNANKNVQEVAETACEENQLKGGRKKFIGKNRARNIEKAKRNDNSRGISDDGNSNKEQELFDGSNKRLNGESVDVEGVFPTKPFIEKETIEESSKSSIVADTLKTESMNIGMNSSQNTNPTIESKHESLNAPIPSQNIPFVHQKPFANAFNAPTQMHYPMPYPKDRFDDAYILQSKNESLYAQDPTFFNITTGEPRDQNLQNPQFWWPGNFQNQSFGTFPQRTQPLPKQQTIEEATDKKFDRSYAPPKKVMPEGLVKWLEKNISEISESNDLSLFNLCMTMDDALDIVKVICEFYSSPKAKEFAEQFVKQKDFFRNRETDSISASKSRFAKTRSTKKNQRSSKANEKERKPRARGRVRNKPKGRQNAARLNRQG